MARFCLGMKKGAMLLGAVAWVLVSCASTDPLRVLDDRSSIGEPADPMAPEASPDPVTDRKPEAHQDQSPRSLAWCIDQALQTNPTTRAAYLSMRAAAMDVGRAKGAYLPTADLDLGASVQGDALTDRVGSTTTAGLSARFSVRYLLYDGGARDAGLSQAEAMLRAADFSHRTTLLDVALQVEEAYFSLQAALWYRRAVDEIIRQYENQHNLAAARFEVGLARRYDMVLAESKLAEASLQRAEAENQVRRMQGDLARVMGLDVRTPLLAEDMDQYSTEIPLEDVDQLIETALARRPELGRARAAVEQALAASAGARSEHLPTIAADAGVGVGLDTDGNLTGPWSAGVGISLPLFRGFQTVYGVERAKYEEARAREELKGAVTDIQFEVWSAVSQAREARETLAAMDNVLAAAEQAVSLAEESYKNGIGTIIEVMDAQSARAGAQLRRVQARLAWHLAIARIERAVAGALSGRRLPGSKGDS